MSGRVLQRLSEVQLKFFEEEGYLVVPDVFAPEDLEPIRGELEAQVDQAVQKLHQQGELKETFPEADFNTRLAKITEHDVEAGKSIMRFLEGKAGGGYSGPGVFGIITHPKMIAVIEDLIGSEIVGSSVYRIRPKVPKLNKGVVPWHQDSGYLMEHCDDEMIVTCWLPLVEATVDNGCLTVLPKAHKQGVVRHNRGGNAGFLVIHDQDLPSGESLPVPIPIPLGGAIFFTNRTPHCSTQNHSDHVRWSLDFRYQSAAVPNNVGQDPGKFSLDGSADEIACYPPEADFVIRSAKYPAKVVRSAEQFQLLRDKYEKIPDLHKLIKNRWA